MHREPKCVILASLAILLACTLAAQAATAPRAAATSDDPVVQRIDTIKDLTKADPVRARARDDLAKRPDLVRRKSIDALIALGKGIKADKTEAGAADADNIRMQVACALSQVRQDAERAKIASALDMLKAWHQDKKRDAALRYWAAMAIANARTAKALAVLKTTLDAADDEVCCMAITRELGKWASKAGKLRTLALPVLVGLLKHKSAAARVAGIDGLRFTRLDVRSVIVPLTKVAADDPDGAVWHAAVTVLRELSRRSLIIRPDASAAQRKEAVRVWLFEWERVHK